MDRALEEIAIRLAELSAQVAALSAQTAQHAPRMAEQAAQTAKRAGVKTLVLTHFVPGDMDWITDKMWHDAAATNYSGEIIVGHDLQSITLG